MTVRLHIVVPTGGGDHVTRPDHDIEMIEAAGDWIRHALCSTHPNPDLWFPQRGESLSQAKAICRACPVRNDCLDYALRTGERHGIWGGKSERERRRLRTATHTTP